MNTIVQVYEQNTYLREEVAHLRLSKKQLSSELRRWKVNCQSLSQDFEKSTLEAERTMEQLEGILIETKSRLSYLTKHKVCSLLIVCI